MGDGEAVVTGGLLVRGNAGWKGGPAAREVRERLRERYGRFFADMGINGTTGELDSDRWPRHRFSTWPYLGSRYGERGHRRILFVGMQWGHDPGHLQSLAEAQEWIERREPPPRNHHIPGTFVASLRWLPARYGWDAVKGEERTCYAILKDCGEWWRSRDNPLAFVGLTNVFKWIRIGKDRRDSKGALRHLDKAAEDTFLMDEILECYRPDVVLFQSTKFCQWARRLREEAGRRVVARSPAEVRVLYHPSNRIRSKGKLVGRWPREVVKARC